MVTCYIFLTFPSALHSFPPIGEISVSERSQMKIKSSIQGTHVESGRNPNYILIRSLFLLVTISLILSICDLISLLLLRPSAPQISFNNVSLTEFNLRHKNILSYNLALDVRVRNPNKKIGIYYENLQVMASYGPELFAAVQAPSFYQVPTNVTTIYPRFSGRSWMDHRYVVASDFVLQRAQGWFNIDVKVLAKVWLSMGPLNVTSYTPVMTCGLLVTLAPPNPNRGSSFNWTRCEEEDPSVGFLVPQIMNAPCCCIVPMTFIMIYLLVLTFTRFV